MKQRPELLLRQLRSLFYGKYTEVVGYYAVIRQAGHQMRYGCRIHCAYPTSSAPNAMRMSDTLRLSDKQCTKCDADVGYYAVIRQAGLQMRRGCPILCGYRTNSAPSATRMSDTMRLSDKQDSKCDAVVRYFTLIGQAASEAQDEQQSIIVGKPQRRTRPKIRRVLLHLISL